ncbi:hypothetical protein TNCV_2204351 [Trichonephila clavipes]|nr:hypothetical protein TNCV_2204351 [Trichonephila clavipes]
MQSPSHHIPDMHDWRQIWLSGWSRMCLTSCKTVHSNTRAELKNKARVQRKERLRNKLQNVVEAPLCCKCASKYDQRVPAIKRDDTLDNNSCLRTYGVSNNESRIGTLPYISSDNSSMIV